jgi:micrococcal nuclease
MPLARETIPVQRVKIVNIASIVPRMEAVVGYVNNILMNKILLVVITVFGIVGTQHTHIVFQKPKETVTKETQKTNCYKVVGVKDGDTMVLLMDGKEQVVRLAHVDCPEKKQPFGTKAKQYASELCFGKWVTVVHSNKYDRNKRLIAEVIGKDGQNLNKQLIKKGLAWHFKKYSKDKEYAQLEVQARKSKVGLWSDANPTAPWDWRKPKKKTTHQ